MSNFASINDFASDRKSAENELEQSGSTSGTATVRPAQDILNAARAGGAQGTSAPPSGLSLVLYRNGFRLGEEGEFRPFSDPRTRPILDALKQGYILSREAHHDSIVPEELETHFKDKAGNKKEVALSIVNRAEEDYDPGFQAFQGQGFSMGASSVSDTFAGATPQELHLDESQPSTTIRIATIDGRRHSVRVNTARYVLDLYRHVMQYVQRAIV